MPVYQDVLMGGEACRDLSRAWSLEAFFSRAPCVCHGMLAVGEGCGLLADGQASQSINHSGIRRDRACLSGVAGCW